MKKYPVTTISLHQECLYKEGRLLRFKNEIYFILSGSEQGTGACLMQFSMALDFFIFSPNRPPTYNQIQPLLKSGGFFAFALCWCQTHQFTNISVLAQWYNRIKAAPFLTLLHSIRGNRITIGCHPINRNL